MRYCLIAIALSSFNAFAATAPDGANMQDSFTTCANLECGHTVSSKFNMDEKFLTGTVVRGETFFANGGAGRSFKTAFKPTRILAVYNPTTGNIYQRGTDYEATSDGISIPEHSTIAFAPAEFVDTATPDEIKNYGVRVTTEFQHYQYAISYEKSGAFVSKTFGSLGAFRKKLGETSVNITFFGDSITEGANATSTFAPPYQPGYAGLVTARLNDLYPTLINARNNSVGGWSAINATASVEYRVNDLKSDLVVLAFGMNDGGGYTPDEYAKNIKYVIDAIRAKQPEASILLVAPTRANPKTFIQKPEYIDAYLPKLIDITKAYSAVEVVDLTSLWDRLLVNKSYYDVTGNGLNHPNDFGHRLIAEAVLNAIMK